MKVSSAEVTRRQVNQTMEAINQAGPALAPGGPAAAPGDCNIAVAFAANHHYAMPLAVTLSSMLRNSGAQATFAITVIGSTLTPDDVARLTRVVRRSHRPATLNFPVADSAWLGAFPDEGHITAEGFLRFLLPELLPVSIEKVIYLDCDLYVRADIQALWNADLAGRAILAAVDGTIQTVSHAEYGLPDYSELGYAADHPYFNSGVMVINLKKWREERIGDRLVAYALEHKHHLRLADQHVLNAVLGSDFGLLDYSWNDVVRTVQSSDALPDSPVTQELRVRRDELLARPSICHYAGDLKPWNSGQYPPQSGAWIAGLLKCGWFGAAGAAAWLAAWGIGQLSARARASLRPILRWRRRAAASRA